MAKVSLDFGALQSVSEERALRGIRAALLVGERRLKADLLSREGAGRVYRRGKTGAHQASAPGAPPAPDTGSLRNRTAADSDVKLDGAAVVGRIVANTGYALALETGTERMAARPFLHTLAGEHGAELASAFTVGAKG